MDAAIRGSRRDAILAAARAGADLAELDAALDAHGRPRARLARVIEYDVPDRTGNGSGERTVLVSTITDPAEARVDELGAHAGTTDVPVGLVYPARVSSLNDAELAALVAEAVVDCHDDDEQLSGLFTMIQDNLAVPFTAEVLGVPVTVGEVELRAYGIVAICHRGPMRQAVGILDLPLPAPAPEGAQWVEAYRWWAER